MILKNYDNSKQNKQQSDSYKIYDNKIIIYFPPI